MFGLSYSFLGSRGDVQHGCITTTKVCSVAAWFPRARSAYGFGQAGSPTRPRPCACDRRRVCGTIPRRRDREPTGEGRGFTRLVQREESALHGGGGRRPLRTPVGRYPRRGGPDVGAARPDDSFALPSRRIPGALMAHSLQSLAAGLSRVTASSVPGLRAPIVTSHRDREAPA